MNSKEDIKYVVEWEFDEEQNEEFGIEATEGEEAGRGLTRIETAWNSCDKLKTDATYHQRYIPINDALGFRHLTSEDKESFVKDRALTEEDKNISLFRAGCQDARNVFRCCGVHYRQAWSNGPIGLWHWILHSSK